MKPKKWTAVYPHGTKEGDEELKFFIAISRNPKYQWRTVSAIAKESGLTKTRVEEIINKYYNKNMVFQNPKNEDQWGYWERVPEMVQKPLKSISQKDQDSRVGKVNKCDSKSCSSGSCDSCNDMVSNYDILRKFMKYSAVEASDIIASWKIHQFKELTMSEIPAVESIKYWEVDL